MTILPLLVSSVTRGCAFTGAVAASRAKTRAKLGCMGSPPMAGRPAGDATTRGPAPAPAPQPVGVVLAGGASRRMGRDKASLAVNGEPLAARAARLLLGVCTRVAIADAGRGLVPDLP